MCMNLLETRQPACVAISTTATVPALCNVLSGLPSSKSTLPLAGIKGGAPLRVALSMASGKGKIHGIERTGKQVQGKL